MALTLYNCKTLTSEGQFNGVAMINVNAITHVISCENLSVTLHLTDGSTIIIGIDDFNKLGINIEPI